MTEKSPGTRAGETQKLRCVIAIIRHADRTPKQKMKLKVQRGGACNGLVELMEEVAGVGYLLLRLLRAIRV